MLEALIIMGLTAVGGGWIATSEYFDGDDSSEEATGLPGAEEEPLEETEDLLTLIFGEDVPPTADTCKPGQCLDNFDPAIGPLLIELPDGFDPDGAEADLEYDPHFHETEITVTNAAGDSFTTSVSGITPDDLGPENLSLVA